MKAHAQETDLPDRYEIVRGQVIPLPPTGDVHGIVESRVIVVLSSEGEHQDLGIVMGGEVGVVVVRDPQTVRGADAAFLLKSQIPPQKTREGYLLTVPALVVEVLSPNDRASEVQGKVLEYLAAGARVVWVVDPINSSVTVNLPDGTARLLKTDDVLWAPGVLDNLQALAEVLFKGLEMFLPGV